MQSHHEGEERKLRQNCPESLPREHIALRDSSSFSELNVPVGRKFFLVSDQTLSCCRASLDAPPGGRSLKVSVPVLLSLGVGWKPVFPRGSGGSGWRRRAQRACSVFGE